MIIPFKFWFNKGLEHSFLSAAIPFGQRFVNTQIQPIAKLVGKQERYIRMTYVTEFASLSPAVYNVTNAGTTHTVAGDWV